MNSFISQSPIQINLAKKFPNRISELQIFFDKPTIVYIDYANVRAWSHSLGWHIDLRRLKQLLCGFSNIKLINIYYGTLVGDAYSESFILEARMLKYAVHTKPVKIMKMSIDVTSVSQDSTDILKNFIRSPLLKLLQLQTITSLNKELSIQNMQGRMFLEDRKCNFDVEIGRDMLLDFSKGNAENFILWSGDSDFSDPVEQLLRDGKKVILFATARKVSTELNQLRSKGLLIFDINKIRDFICRKGEINPNSLI